MEDWRAAECMDLAASVMGFGYFYDAELTDDQRTVLIEWDRRLRTLAARIEWPDLYPPPAIAAILRERGKVP